MGMRVNINMRVNVNLYVVNIYKDQMSVRSADVHK